MPCGLFCKTSKSPVAIGLMLILFLFEWSGLKTHRTSRSNKHGWKTNEEAGPGGSPASLLSPIPSICDERR